MEIYKLITVKFNEQNLPEFKREELCLSAEAISKRLASYGPENSLIYAADLSEYMPVCAASIAQILDRVKKTIGENYMPRIDMRVAFLGGIMEPVEMSFLIQRVPLYC